MVANSEASKAAEDFLKDLGGGPTAVQKYLGRQFLAEIPAADVEAMFQTFAENFGSVKSFSKTGFNVQATTQLGKVVTLNYHLICAYDEADCRVVLVQQGNQWKVHGFFYREEP